MATIQTTYSLEPLTCPSCIAKIETVLGRIAGVDEVRVLFHQSKVRVRFDPSRLSADELAEKLEKLGYPVRKTVLS